MALFASHPPIEAAHRGAAERRAPERAATHEVRRMQFKIEVQDEKGIWTDVRGADGKPLVFDDEGERARRRWPSAFRCSCRWSSTAAASARA